MAGRPPVLDAEKLKKLREWRAKPRSARPSLRVLAELMGVSYSVAKNGAAGRRYYAKVAL
jgi:hypothetical protein